MDVLMKNLMKYGKANDFQISVGSEILQKSGYYPYDALSVAPWLVPILYLQQSHTIIVVLRAWRHIKLNAHIAMLSSITLHSMLMETHVISPLLDTGMAGNHFLHP